MHGWCDVVVLVCNFAAPVGKIWECLGPPEVVNADGYATSLEAWDKTDYENR